MYSMYMNMYYIFTMSTFWTQNVCAYLGTCNRTFEHIAESVKIHATLAFRRAIECGNTCVQVFVSFALLTKTRHSVHIEWAIAKHTFIKRKYANQPESIQDYCPLKKWTISRAKKKKTNGAKPTLKCPTFPAINELFIACWRTRVLRHKISSQIWPYIRMYVFVSAGQAQGC